MVIVKQTFSRLQLSGYNKNHQVYYSQILPSAHSVICELFLQFSERAAIISLCNIHLLIFITKTVSVYCAVRAQYLSAI